MDLSVPGGMGGQEAVGKLRAIDPAAKVVVASGYAHEGVLANYREHGFDGRLSKPFLLAELEALLRQLLRD
ncbi:MAG TPA: response regulator [Desulfurivibrio alkaliphilus]|uniref:Response regulator n=1 Tax=Desulfurivibrio alkaliphilus TaxID=427923 RepID=A0A7C2TGS7_9BACT|nr:response regulator [Desulfurivibrio alkaliphilus]